MMKFDRLPPKPRDESFYRTTAVVVRDALKKIRDSGDLDIVGCNVCTYDAIICVIKLEQSKFV